MKTTFSIVTFFFFVAVLAGYLYGLRIFLVTSGSMEPEISRGDLIITKEQDTYKLGDIISYSDNNAQAVVTHRISSKIKIEAANWYKTMGSANSEADAGMISHSEIIGKVVKIIPSVGKTFFIPKSTYILVVTWAVSLLLILIEIKQIIKVSLSNLSKITLFVENK